MNLGLDLPQILPEQDNLMGLSYFDIRNLKQLETYLEDFRPQLVVLDSLTSISFGVRESENDAEFSRNIYRLKDLLQKYNCSGLLIHHNNKQGGISGSERIRAACWGTAQLEMANGTLVDEDEETGMESTVFSEDYRFLKLNNTRSTEASTYKLLLNPSQEWITKGIYEYCGETSDPTGEKREATDKIYRHLLKSGLPLEPMEINETLGLPSTTLYRALDKLSRNGKVTKRRSNSNPKAWVYQATNKKDSQHGISNRNSTFDPSPNLKKNDPPPCGNVGMNNSSTHETITQTETQLIPTSFPRHSHGELDSHGGNTHGNKVGMNETIENKEVQELETSHSHIPTTPPPEKMKNETDSKTEIEQETPYCDKFSFIGVKVRYFKTPHIEGRIITNPKQLGSGFFVYIDWEDNDEDYMPEGCWVTALLSDEVDFKAWQEEQLNG